MKFVRYMGPRLTKIVLIAMLAVLCGCLKSADEEELQELNKLGKSEGGVFPDREDYYGVFVHDENNAWVVGGRGVIIHVSDKGQKLTLLPSGEKKAIYDISFKDLENGLAVGQDGLILKTTDGGKTWKHIPLELPLEDWQVAQPHIFALSRGTDPNKVWAVGPVGAVIYSADDGETWENLSLGRDVTLNGVSFASDTEGWTSGEFGTILHTADGGKTWQEQTNVHDLPKYTRPELSEEEAIRQRVPPLYLEDVFLIAVDFRNPTEGYVTGESGILLRTDDAGQTWTNVPSGSFNTLLSVALAKNGEHEDAVTGVLGTLATDSNGKWQINEDIREHVLTWIRDVDFAHEGGFGIACGGHGSIITTLDGGKSWKIIDKEKLARISTS